MNTFYENSGSNTFLCCSLDENDTIDSFYYGMLSNNKIDNVIPVLYSVENNNAFFRYNVSSKISLCEYFSGIVSKKRVVNVFYSIINAIIESEEYMIDPKIFILNSEYIFVDVSSLKAYLICLPIVNYDSNVKIVDFFKNIMFSLAFDQDENNDYVAKILSYLNSASNFSLTEFKKILTEILDESDSLHKMVQKEPVKKDNLKNEYKNYKKSEASNENKERKEQNTFSENKFDKKEGGAESIRDSSASGNHAKKVNNDHETDSNQGKKMSFLHLMANFSKENLEIYKSQKSSLSSSDKKAENISQRVKPAFEIPGENKHLKNTDISKNESAGSVRESSENINKTSFAKQNNETNRSAFAKSSGARPKIDFGATVYFDEKKLNSTVMIGENIVSESNSSESFPHIIRRKTQDDIRISKSPFKIGKEETFVDYCVKGNPAISGCHAFIVFDDGKYYIKDTNSTNHVCINNKRIQSNVLLEIKHNDVIKLADEYFDFKLC